MLMGREVLTGVQVTGKPVMRLVLVIGVLTLPSAVYLSKASSSQLSAILLFPDVMAYRVDDEIVSCGFFIS